MTSGALIIGDVHGDAARLRRMLDMVEEDTDRQVVFLGDYVNIGSGSAHVLEMLTELKRRLGSRLTLLGGNHDAAMLAVVHGGSLGDFLAIGGAPTIQSYIGRRCGDVGRAFRSAVPTHHVELLESLGDRWQDEGVLAMHMWPRERLELGAMQVVLGHYLQSDGHPLVEDSVIYIDTGCGSQDGGRLTSYRWPERDWIGI